jgi:hypothetical protein
LQRKHIWITSLSHQSASITKINVKAANAKNSIVSSISLPSFRELIPLKSRVPKISAAYVAAVGQMVDVDAVQLIWVIMLRVEPNFGVWRLDPSALSGLELYPHAIQHALQLPLPFLRAGPTAAHHDVIH